jgi:hypothetical protein
LENLMNLKESTAMNAARVTRLFRTLLGVCIAGLFGTSVSQATIVIDPFTAEQSVEVFGGPPGPASAFDSLNPAGVVGGERDVLLTRTSDNAGGVAGDVSLSLVGAIAYASDVRTTGNALVVYDGVDADAAINFTGLGGVDLTESGQNTRFEVGVTSDLGASVVITVYTDSTRYSTATVPVPADPSYTFTIAQVPFASFSVAGSNGGADFANVGAITVAIDGSIAATDVLVNYFVSTGDIPPQEENDPPTIECPSNMCVTVSKCKTSAVVTYPDPVVTVDPDCAPAAVVCAPPSGSSFPLGTNTVVCIVTDSCGQTDQCSFEIVVTKEGCQQPPKPPCKPPKPSCGGSHSGGWWHHACHWWKNWYSGGHKSCGSNGHSGSGCRGR